MTLYDCRDGAVSATLSNIAVALVVLVSTPVLPQSIASQTQVPIIAREAMPSVVRIILRDQTGRELASGSGFVVTADCKIATNYHVIRTTDASEGEATFADGASYRIAGVLAIDPDRDLAVLRLNAGGKHCGFLRVGDSGRVEVGERVLAIGSPLAFSQVATGISTEGTVSDGIVSGVRNWPEHKMKVFQITAPISPGSSGGALVDLSGDAIGVTFAQISGGQNMNLAIPTAYLTPLLARDSLESISDVNETSKQARVGTSEDVTGTYTGVWRSGKFDASGAAAMTVTVKGGKVIASIFLTGSQNITRVTLSGDLQKMGETVWTVDLKASRPKLSAKGVFRNRTFVGDYNYSRFRLSDHGQWILNKE